MGAKIDDLLRIAAGHSTSDLRLKVSAFPGNANWRSLHPVADAPRLKPETRSTWRSHMIEQAKAEVQRDI